MILFREKVFTRRDPLPNPFPIPDEWEDKYDNVIYKVSQVDKEYNKDITKFGPTEKALIKGFRKDLKNGYIYVDGPSGGDTHYLSDYSSPNKYHRMSKSINDFDRLVYLIYPPILDEKNSKVIIPIVIQSLDGHKIYGQGTYSDTEE